jgi:hypothetical protein
MGNDSHSTGTLIRRLMRAGNTEAILQVLRESGARQAAAPAERAILSEQQYRSGLIDADAWYRAQLQLYQAVLDLPFDRDDETKHKPQPLDKLQLRRLVDNHDIAPALRLCETLGDASILMQAQYEIGRKLFAENAIGLETWEIIQHKTIYLLWELSEQAPGRQKTGKGVWTRVGGFLKKKQQNKKN